jgi:hypothetical protein
LGEREREKKLQSMQQKIVTSYYNNTINKKFRLLYLNPKPHKIDVWSFGNTPKEP